MREVRGRGPVPCDYLILSKAPGWKELKQGVAQVGDTGRTLDAFLMKCGLAPGFVRVDNAVPVEPVGEDPSPEQMEQWSWRVYDILKTVKPKVVGLMGLPVVRHYLDPNRNLEVIHGLPVEHGFDGVGGEVLAVPMYDVAAGLHSPEMMAQAFHDVRAFVQTCRGKLRPVSLVDPYPDPEYHFATRHEHIKITCDPAVDTEGTPDAPYSLQFSCRPGEGWIILASRPDLIKVFKARIKGRKLIIHNTMYDLPMFRAMGIELGPDDYYDTMVGVYELGNEAQGLKPLAARYCGMTMREYPELIAPYDRMLVLKYLRRASKITDWPPSPLILEPDGKGGRKIRKPLPIPTRIKTILQDSANPDTDPRKRWNKVDQELRDLIEYQAGPMPRFDLSLVPEEEFRDYAARDPDATLRLHPIIDHLVTEEGLDQILRVDLSVIPMAERMQANGLPASREHFAVLGDELRKARLKQQKVINKHNGGEYLNSNSQPQVARLLFEVLGLEPVKWTPGDRESTNDKVLQTLAPHHPAARDISEYREISKMESFVKSLPEYIQDDDRARFNLRVTRVSSGRFSSTEFNAMAIPVRSEWGKKIRSCFRVPDPELSMMSSCDLDQIEMRVMAHESEDESLIGLFNRGEDVHSDTAAKMFGVKLKDVDPVRHRYPAKRVGFGIITGITEDGLLDQMFLAGIYDYDRDACKEMIQDYFKIRPGIPKYMNLCRAEARQHGYVTCMGGRRRWLPGIWSPVPRIKAEAERQSHSHKIQSSAQWLMKRGMRRWWDLTRRERLPVEPLLQIHDELLSEFPPKIEERVREITLGALTADSETLSVPIKAKFGVAPSWGEVKD